ncbi:unnamed protein product [Hydatigera taeniaeformis]|uniref:Uncharacterized protein n=1 Tax=Hydatigena taeniaeformis TaxID=6205 RepID=A0A0R3WSZ9_HYDTA|nr:unnamed protein product [Hydatigera taeniaeformis]
MCPADVTARLSPQILHNQWAVRLFTSPSSRLNVAPPDSLTCRHTLPPTLTSAFFAPSPLLPLFVPPPPPPLSVYCLLNSTPESR